jgi:hypothetical protein
MAHDAEIQFRWSLTAARKVNRIVYREVKHITTSLPKFYVQHLISSRDLLVTRYPVLSSC